MNRKQIIQNLRIKRYTFQQIGDLLGVSRQRAFQILNHQPKISKPPEKLRLLCAKPNNKPPVPLSSLKKKLNNGYLSQILKDKIPTVWGEKQENIRLRKMGGIDRLAEIVRIRDNHTCQICGKTWEEGQRRLDVHHINPENESNITYSNYKKADEMITLCHKCHLNLEHIRKKFCTFTHP